MQNLNNFHTSQPTKRRLHGSSTSVRTEEMSIQ